MSWALRCSRIAYAVCGRFTRDQLIHGGGGIAASTGTVGWIVPNLRDAAATRAPQAPGTHTPPSRPSTPLPRVATPPRLRARVDVLLFVAHCLEG